MAPTQGCSASIQSKQARWQARSSGIQPLQHVAGDHKAADGLASHTGELSTAGAALQEKDLIRLKREAKKEGGFYVEPEAKLAFVIRVRGINDMHPKTKKILQLLRLRQIFNGVFVKVCAAGRLPVRCTQCQAAATLTCLGPQINKATVNMLRRVEPYIAWGYPNLKTVRELLYKRGFGKVRCDACCWARPGCLQLAEASVPLRRSSRTAFRSQTTPSSRRCVCHAPC